MLGCSKNFLACYFDCAHSTFLYMSCIILDRDRMSIQVYDWSYCQLSCSLHAKTTEQRALFWETSWRFSWSFENCVVNCRFYLKMLQDLMAQRESSEHINIQYRYSAGGVNIIIPAEATIFTLGPVSTLVCSCWCSCHNFLCCNLLPIFFLFVLLPKWRTLYL